MITLIIKDLKIAFKHIGIPILFFWIYLIMYSGKSTDFIMVSLGFILYALIENDKNNMDILYLSLPLKRSNIVIARYLFSLIIISMVIIVTFMFKTILYNFFPIQFTDNLSFIKFVKAQIVVLYVILASFPIFFRYGIYLNVGMKTIILLLVCITIIGVGLIVIIININFAPLVLMFNDIQLALLTFLLFIGSLLLSIRILKKREF